MAKKISFPMGNGKVENGYYNPTSIPQALQNAKNKKKVEARVRLAKKTNLKRQAYFFVMLKITKNM